MGFPRPEYWKRLPFSPAGDLPGPGTELKSPPWQADSLPLSHLGRKPVYLKTRCNHPSLEAPVHPAVLGPLPGGPCPPRCLMSPSWRPLSTPLSCNRPSLEAPVPRCRRSPPAHTRAGPLGGPLPRLPGTYLPVSCRAWCPAGAQRVWGKCMLTGSPSWSHT